MQDIRKLKAIQSIKSGNMSSASSGMFNRMAQATTLKSSQKAMLSRFDASIPKKIQLLQEDVNEYL